MMPRVMGRPEADESEAEATMNGESENNVTDAVVSMHPRAERAQHLRIIEAILFAATEPVGIDKLNVFLPQGTDCDALLTDLEANYANRGVNLVRINGKYMLRTAPDVSFVLRREQVQQKRLTKAGLETLAIIAYHQPVTRAEIEEIRGVAISKGTLDILLEIGWAKMRGRRKSPGRPITYGTTEGFMRQFGLNEITDLPGLQELRAAGLLDSQLPPGFDLPMPRISDELTADEDPLDGTESEPPLEMHLEEPESQAADPEKDGRD